MFTFSQYFYTYENDNICLSFVTKYRYYTSLINAIKYIQNIFATVTTC